MGANDESFTFDIWGVSITLSLNSIAKFLNIPHEIGAYPTLPLGASTNNDYDIED